MQVACDCIVLIALTGCRKGEVQRLRWRHVDPDGRRLVLPPNEHKGGRKTGRCIPSGYQHVPVSELRRGGTPA